MDDTGKEITYFRTVKTFATGRACSDTLFHMLSGAYGQPMEREEKAIMPMAGGIMQHGYQCGMLWGAALAAGARAHHLYGPGPEAEARAVLAARALADSFHDQNGTIDCFELTEIDKDTSVAQMVTFFIFKGGTFRCFHRTGKYAPRALREVDAALASGQAEVPDGCASCAAALAREAGLSDLQATMAAGLAGGIGLSGGACGALGAAIWAYAIRRLEEGGALDFRDAGALEIIDAFLKGSDYQFRCDEIVGKKFGGLAEHAEHLASGGCAGLLEILAAAV